MQLPGAYYFELVYTCDGMEQHEVREQVNSVRDIEDYAFQDADPCTRCRTDYREFSTVTLDRIEVVHPND